MIGLLAAGSHVDPVPVFMMAVYPLFVVLFLLWRRIGRVPK